MIAFRELLLGMSLIWAVPLLGCNHSSDSGDDLGMVPVDAGLPAKDAAALERDFATGAFDGGDSDGGDGGAAGSGELCTSSGFCFEYPAKFGIVLNDVWGASATDVWAVGYSGALLHFDGANWSLAKSPSRSTLYGIAGRSGSDILAVGEAGTVLHYDGATWSALDIGATATLYDVAMPSGTEAWISGEKVLVRRTAGTWQAVTPPYIPTSHSYLHAIGPAHVWLFHYGTAQYWNGTTWAVVDLNTGVGAHAVSSVSGKSTEAVYACVQQENYPLRKWDGANFVKVLLPDPVRVLALNSCAVEAVSASDVWLFGGSGIGHFDGTSWTVVDSAMQPAIFATWSRDSAAVAVGNHGRVLMRSGPSFAVQNAGAGSDVAFAHSLRAKADVEWTSIGGALLRRSRGSTWLRTPHTKLEVGGLLPIDATRAWAVSTNSGPDAVLYWNGTSFESKATEPAAYWMNQSWQSPATGELVFVGQAGITSYAAGTFTRLVTTGWLNDIDGILGSATWAVGDAGAAWRRSLPTGFAKIATGTTVDLAAVHVVSDAEVYLGGDSSTLLRYDGATFKPLMLPPLRIGSRNYRMVVGIAGALSSARGLWVLVSGGEVIELHDGKPPVIHSVYFEGNNIAFTNPDELVVLGNGNCIVRKKFP